MHLSHWLNLFRQHRKLTINRRVCVCLRKSAKSLCVARWARPAVVSTLSPVPSLQLPQFVHATPLRMRSHRIRANSLTLVCRIGRRLRPLCAAFPLFHICNWKCIWNYTTTIVRRELLYYAPFFTVSTACLQLLGLGTQIEDSIRPG